MRHPAASIASTAVVAAGWPRVWNRRGVARHDPHARRPLSRTAGSALGGGLAARHASLRRRGLASGARPPRVRRPRVRRRPSPWRDWPWLAAPPSRPRGPASSPEPPSRRQRPPRPSAGERRLRRDLGAASDAAASDAAPARCRRADLRARSPARPPGGDRDARRTGSAVSGGGPRRLGLGSAPARGAAAGREPSCARSIASISGGTSLHGSSPDGRGAGRTARTERLAVAVAAIDPLRAVAPVEVRLPDARRGLLEARTACCRARRRTAPGPGRPRTRHRDPGHRHRRARRRARCRAGAAR